MYHFFNFKFFMGSSATSSCLLLLLFLGYFFWSNQWRCTKDNNFIVLILQHSLYLGFKFIAFHVFSAFCGDTRLITMIIFCYLFIKLFALIIICLYVLVSPTLSSLIYRVAMDYNNDNNNRALTLKDWDQLYKLIKIWSLLSSLLNLLPHTF